MLPCMASCLLYIAAIFLLYINSCNANSEKWHQELPHNEENPGTRARGFKTEPFVRPQIFKPITKNVASHPLYQGYIFLAMMHQDGGTWGPHIYDHDGHIVWHGNNLVDSRVADFRVCDYMGVTGKHLCFHERVPNPNPDGSTILKKVILNDRYQVVHNFTTLGNGHEFHMVDRGHRFVTMNYKKIKRDLRPYSGLEDGYISDACILEYRSDTGELVWQWCYLDHFTLSAAKLFFESENQTRTSTPKAGRGTEDTPWDVFHLNAVDKDEQGNYIASFRHLDQIIKVAGPDSLTHEPNTVIWRLNGIGNDFAMDFNFSKQHTVRYILDHPMRRKGVEIISLFNNAWEGVLPPTANQSSGQIIALDTKKWKSTLLREYKHPEDLLVGSRGSMQVLPNGNAFVGWGILPEISEFSENGTLLYHAHFGKIRKNPQYSYRAFNQKWIGRPPWRPKLLAYKQTCSISSPTWAYVSWNGATEVKEWRFFTGASEGGPWIPAAVVKKHGFETKTRLDRTLASFVSAQAFDASGNELTSVYARVYIPPLKIEHRCDSQSCPNHFNYDSNQSRIEQCQNMMYTPFLLPLLLLLVVSEFIPRATHEFLCVFVDIQVNAESFCSALRAIESAKLSIKANEKDLPG